MPRHHLVLTFVSTAILAAVPARAQSPVCQEGLASFGGTEVDFVFAFGVDAQGDRYQAGGTESFGQGAEDFLILKHAAGGGLLWARTWGSSDADLLDGFHVEPDGSFLACGLREVSGGDSDALVVRFDATGAEDWAWQWDGGNGEDWTDAVLVDAQGNVIAAGGTGSPSGFDDDVLLQKYDASGHLMWSKTWAGADQSGENANAACLDASDADPANHRVYVAGKREVQFEGDAFLLQYDTDGNLQWARTWDTGGCDDAFTVVCDANGDVYITGKTIANGDCDSDLEDVFVAKWDAAGNLLWDRVWDAGTEDGGGIAVDPATNGIVLSGLSTCGGADGDAFLVALDAAGQLLWSRGWGGPGEDFLVFDYDGATLVGSGASDGCCGAFFDCAGTLSDPAVVPGTPGGVGGSLAALALDPQGMTTSPLDAPGCNGFDALLVELGPCGPTTRAAFCFGDGSLAACPCGNTGGSGEGCANSTGSGALLGASGTNGVAAGDLVLEAAGLPVNQPGLFFQGNNAIAGGCGVPFGDGLRCAGGSVVRLEVVAASGAGTADSTVDVATRGGVSAGDLRRYQYWYRDPNGTPCGTSFNLSNGLELLWLP